MINMIKTNKTLITNILCIFFVSLILYFLISSTFLIIHEYIYPYYDFLPDRMPSFLGSFLTVNFLPSIFNQNPNDFKAYGLGNLIYNFLILSTIYFFASSFFITSSEKPYKQKEFPYIFLIAFILYISPLAYMQEEWTYYLKMDDCIVFFEYFLPYLLIFILYIYLYKILFSNNSSKNKFLELIIHSFAAFLLGAWNEFYNVLFFFNILAIVFILFFYNKKLLLNKYFLTITFSFLIGLGSYYLFRNYMTDALGFSLINIIQNINIKKFLKEYFDYIFINKIYYNTILIILWLILYNNIKNDIIKHTFFLTISIYSGLLGLFFITIFTQNVYTDVFFFIERTDYNIIFNNILEFIILMQLGCFYFIYKNSINLYKYLKIIMTAIIILLLVKVTPYQIEAYKNRIYGKKLAFDIDHRNLVFSTLGEITILPESYLKVGYVLFGTIFHYDTTITDEIESFKFIPNHIYYKEIYHHYKKYFYKTYNKNFLGVIYLPDNFANEEYKKRREILQDNIINKEPILFNKLNKFFNYKKITLKELNKLITPKNKNIILKANAFIYFKNKKYEKSLEYYNEYIENTENPDQYVLMVMQNIYSIIGNYDKEIEILTKLHQSDKDNFIYYEEYLYTLFYKLHNYKKALIICDKIIKKFPNAYSPYINKAIILCCLNKPAEAKKSIEQGKKIHPRGKLLIENILESYNVTDISDIKKIPLQHIDF